jgi:prephenate dehydrogenase
VLAKASKPLEDFVTKLGATSLVLAETDHNEAVARISHLPHVLAAAELLAIADGDQSFALAASSFKDSTRVAGTKPELTAGMVANNRDEVLRSIEALKGVLEEFTDVLTSGDDESLTRLFERAKSLRDKNL